MTLRVNVEQWLTELEEKVTRSHLILPLGAQAEGQQIMFLAPSVLPA